MIQATTNHSFAVGGTDRRPVVCHVIHALGLGGAERLVDQMVRRMSDRYRCVVATLDDIGEIGEQLKADGVPVTCLEREAGIDLKCARRLEQFADLHGVQILHAHQYTPFFQSMLSRGLTGQRPVVFTEHGRHHPDVPCAKRILANRLMLRRKDRLIACGGAVRDALVRNEGLPRHRVDVIYNGVDLEELQAPAMDARPAIRGEFSFRDDDFVVVQIARLHSLKDHGTALRTMARIRNTRPTPRLLIVGEGDEREAIEREIREQDLSEHVRLAGSRNDVADILAASDAFLLTSISEGIPLTIIEAMAAERPVVATRVGGVAEMVRQNLNGYLAPAGADAELAEALRHLQQDPCLRRGMGEVGRHVAEDRFSLNSMLTSYVQVYDQIVRPSRSRITALFTRTGAEVPEATMEA